MNQLDLILENIRLGHIEQLLQEAQSDLEVIRGQRLINESIMQIRGAINSQMLTEDENDSFLKRHGGKIAAGVGAGVLANGGTFGAGAQNAVQSGVEAIKNIGHSAFDKTSEGLNKSANYYSHGLSSEDPKSLTGASEGANLNHPLGILGYGSDGRVITGANAGKFSEDTAEVIKDRAHEAVNDYGDDVVGGAIGAGLGGLAGAALGSKAKKSALGGKIGAGIGGLAGILA
jgi:hypothetical protein